MSSVGHGDERSYTNSISGDDDYSDKETEDLPYMQGYLSKWTNYIHGWQSNEFDDCRFDLTVANDSVWYVRCLSCEDTTVWIEALEAHKSESGYGSQCSLRRHGSLLSLHSFASHTSTGSFRAKGFGLREKLAEMDTYKDILAKQVDTLQSYFDQCAEAFGQPKERYEVADLEIDDLNVAGGQPQQTAAETSQPVPPSYPDLTPILKPQSRPRILPPDMTAQNIVDFRGEAITFKATTCGILSSLSICIDLMNKREESIMKRLEKERERRQRAEEMYKVVADKKHDMNGPDCEEGPGCFLAEEQFYDAVETAMDKRDEEDRLNSRNEEERLVPSKKLPSEIKHSRFEEVEAHVKELVNYTLETVGPDGQWELIHREGNMKVYRRELEEKGLVCDPLKATHVVKGFTAHEICHYFFEPSVRMEWEDICNAVVRSRPL